MDCSPTRLLCAWNFPGKNTRVGCRFLLQEIFPTQGSASCLLQWQAGSLLLSHQGSPGFKLLVFVLICYTAIANTYTFSLKSCYEVEAVVQESDSNCFWLCADRLAACWGLTGSVSRASLMAQWVNNLPGIQETEEMQVRSLGGEDPVEEEMATHSNILAWETPWTEEPGGLHEESMGLQRIGRDQATTHVHAHASRTCRERLAAGVGHPRAWHKVPPGCVLVVGCCCCWEF